MSRRLLAGFLIFAAALIVLFEIPLGLALASNARATALTEVQNDGSSIGLVVSASLARGDPAGARSVIDRFAHVEHAVVVVIDNRHVELSSGAGALEEMGDPATRVILRSAGTGKAVGEEGSHDPDDDFLYAVVPVVLKVPTTSTRPEPRVGTNSARLVLLVAEPAAPLHAQINRDAVRLALFGMVVLALAAGIGALLARSLTRPLAGIEATVSAYGSGDLSARVPPRRGPPELQALGETVNQMAGRLDDLLRAQRAFVADASHQLRTPLTALRLRLENLEGTLTARDAEDELAPAIAETDRLSHVIDGLLVLARTDGSRPALVTVDVSAALVERIDAWGALAGERHVVLELDAAGAPNSHVRALAGPGYLEQVLDNLLANALDATPPGGFVRLSVGRIDDDVDVHVIDSGRGMRADDRARAFARFWRSEGSSADGSGLGLAIVAQLVHVSGGTCRLDAGPTGGIDAVVRLRAAR
jgi:signal transduction histidine kinase